MRSEVVASPEYFSALMCHNGSVDHSRRAPGARKLAPERKAQGGGAEDSLTNTITCQVCLCVGRQILGSEGRGAGREGLIWKIVALPRGHMNSERLQCCG
eukprot:scaffold74987_cov31-Tisochrysis_lutea.AAC.2